MLRTGLPATMDFAGTAFEVKAEMDVVMVTIETGDFGGPRDVGGTRDFGPGGEPGNDQGAPLAVAIGMPMSAAERDGISAALGSRYDVVDIRDADEDTAVIVVPPCSRQAIETLRDAFPAAAVLVVEGLSSGSAGPVTMALRAGATGYAVSEPDPSHLARSIRCVRGCEAA
jgi:hypothetical protein